MIKEDAMDDKTKRGAADRNKVAGKQDYEVRVFAEKFGLSVNQVKGLIAEHGNDRAKLEAAARKLAS